MPRILIALGLVVALAFSASAADTKYTLTGDNTKITFVGKKPAGKHDGGFAKVTGSATATGDLTKLAIAVDIDTDSIHADDAKLTAHLKNKDFFDVKNHPKATFKSTKVEKGNGATYTVTGDLTMLGNTKSVTFPATIIEKDGLLQVSTTFSIDRTEWGMKYGKGMIDDLVALTISVTAKK